MAGHIRLLQRFVLIMSLTTVSMADLLSPLAMDKKNGEPPMKLPFSSGRLRLFSGVRLSESPSKIDTRSHAHAAHAHHHGHHSGVLHGAFSSPQVMGR